MTRVSATAATQHASSTRLTVVCRNGLVLLPAKNSYSSNGPMLVTPSR